MLICRHYGDTNMGFATKSEWVYMRDYEDSAFLTGTWKSVSMSVQLCKTPPGTLQGNSSRL